jgi:hypothetical protein
VAVSEQREQVGGHDARANLGIMRRPPLPDGTDQHDERDADQNDDHPPDRQTGWHHLRSKIKPERPLPPCKPKYHSGDDEYEEDDDDSSEEKSVPAGVAAAVAITEVVPSQAEQVEH